MNYLEIENGIKHLSYNNESLLKIILICGECKPALRKNYYHSLLRSIMGQQLSTYAAGTIYKRFINLFNCDLHRK